ncbi:hypothetical protein E2C01_054926 [Portunus trituberculatus]|uniref:Uncharacterized protein n=1 Tax=Portunus trituberculatus TaxID=210409 RepID=A0A5B7GUK1_PORTR|nr:hypothetical protein [Portunus trituberculatus]
MVNCSLPFGQSPLPQSQPVLAHSAQAEGMPTGEIQVSPSGRCVHLIPSPGKARTMADNSAVKTDATEGSLPHR